MQEQLLAGREPGAAWISDTCKAILDTTNTSDTMARELLQVGSACLRAAAAREVEHAGVAGTEAGSVKEQESLMKVVVEATHLLASKGVGCGSGSKGERTPARKRGRPPKREGMQPRTKGRPLECKAPDAEKGEGVGCDGEEKLLRCAMVVKLVVEVAAHERQRLPQIEAGQHCLCAGLLERSTADCSRGLQYTAASEFSKLARHLLFVAQHLSNAIETGGVGKARGVARTVSVAHAGSMLALVKTLLQELFSVSSI